MEIIGGDMRETKRRIWKSRVGEGRDEQGGGEKREGKRGERVKRGKREEVRVG